MESESMKRSYFFGISASASTSEINAPFKILWYLIFFLMSGSSNFSKFISIALKLNIKYNITIKDRSYWIWLKTIETVRFFWACDFFYNSLNTEVRTMEPEYGTWWCFTDS